MRICKGLRLGWPTFPGFTAFVLLLASAAFAGEYCVTDVPPARKVPPPGAGEQAPKTWYKVKNFLDVEDLGRLNRRKDRYNFSYRGKRIKLADPSILKIGQWFYITGTTDTDGRWIRNFEIYRTRNFERFDLHMLAFNERRGAGSGHFLEPNNLRFSDGGKYNQLWAPQLYIDPTSQVADPKVHLVFAAVKLIVKPSELPADAEGSHSVFRAALRRSDFLAWHQRDPITGNGRHFADVRSGSRFPSVPAGFFYRPENDPSRLKKYDGGYCVHKEIPAGGAVEPLLAKEDNLGKCGKLRRSLYPPDYRVYYNCVHPAAWMSIDPFVFYDQRLGREDPWKRVMLYNWSGAREVVMDSERGNHIAAAPMASNNRFDAGPAGGLVPMAVNRNQNNRIQGTVDGVPLEIDNGAVAGGRAGSFHPWGGGAVAEGASAFYHQDNRRYYLIYSRNPVSSPAYQIVYRMTNPGEPFRSLSLSLKTDTIVQEHVLLRADPFPPSSIVRRANYGHPEVFSFEDKDGRRRYYLIFHVKLDVLNLRKARTLFFKELTLEPDGSGRLKQLFEQHTDPDRNIRFFRMPLCRRTGN